MSDSNKRYREASPQQSSISPTSSGSGTYDERDEEAGAKRPRSCIGIACMPCRKRKSKCDGQEPKCLACLTIYNTEEECHYDLDQDQRRKGALRRVIKEKEEELNEKEQQLEELQLKLAAVEKESSGWEYLLTDIMTFIRLSDPSLHLEFVNFVRENHSTSFIKLTEKISLLLKQATLKNLGSIPPSIYLSIKTEKESARLSGTSHQWPTTTGSSDDAVNGIEAINGGSEHALRLNAMRLNAGVPNQVPGLPQNGHFATLDQNAVESAFPSHNSSPEIEDTIVNGQLVFAPYDINGQPYGFYHNVN